MNATQLRCFGEVGRHRCQTTSFNSNLTEICFLWFLKNCFSFSVFRVYILNREKRKKKHHVSHLSNELSSLKITQIYIQSCRTLSFFSYLFNAYILFSSIKKQKNTHIKFNTIKRKVEKNIFCFSACSFLCHLLCQLIVEDSIISRAIPAGQTDEVRIKFEMKTWFQRHESDYVEFLKIKLFFYKTESSDCIVKKNVHKIIFYYLKACAVDALKTVVS